MSLLGLPNELLQAIAVDCGVEGGGLILTNKRLYENTGDILWQSAIKDPDTLTKIISGAAGSGNLRMMKKAAAYGADFDLIHPVTWPREITEFDYAKSLPEWRAGDELSQFWASPLHLAVYHNHYDTVEWLITVQGVDIDAPGRLICECRGAADEKVSQGGMLEDYPVWTALHFAICQQHDSIARLLLSRNATSSVMLDPSIMRDPEVMSRCVEVLRNGNTREFSGHTVEMTALQTAALHGTKSLVSHLVQARGMDINEVEFSIDAYQPIHYAVLSPDEAMIKHLASLGADLDGTDATWVDVKDTPIYFAILHRELKGLFKLLELGAKTWLDDGQKRKAILSHYDLLDIIHSVGSAEQVTAIMVKLIDKTLQDYATDSTGCLPIESEIQRALKTLAQVALEDWNPSNKFSKTAKRLLRNVLASTTNNTSPHNLANHYHGRELTRFAKKVLYWKYDLSGEEEEEIRR